MERQAITFSANEQNLIKTGGINDYASNTVGYIVAVFDLGENWNSFDSVRAIFSSDYAEEPAVLVRGSCVVPFEVPLKGKGELGRISSGSWCTGGQADHIPDRSAQRNS